MLGIRNGLEEVGRNLIGVLICLKVLSITTVSREMHLPRVAATRSPLHPPSFYCVSIIW
jgi:hypothetical protein